MAAQVVSADMAYPGTSAGGDMSHAECGGSEVARKPGDCEDKVEGREVSENIEGDVPPGEFDPVRLEPSEIRVVKGLNLDDC